MKELCPNCKNICEVEKIVEKTTLKISNTNITVDAEYMLCSGCGEKYHDPKYCKDEIEIAAIKWLIQFALCKHNDTIMLIFGDKNTEVTICQACGRVVSSTQSDDRDYEITNINKRE